MAFSAHASIVSGVLSPSMICLTSLVFKVERSFPIKCLWSLGVELAYPACFDRSRNSVITSLAVLFPCHNIAIWCSVSRDLLVGLKSFLTLVRKVTKVGKSSPPVVVFVMVRQKFSFHRFASFSFMNNKMKATLESSVV